MLLAKDRELSGKDEVIQRLRSSWEADREQQTRVFVETEERALAAMAAKDKELAGTKEELTAKVRTSVSFL